MALTVGTDAYVALHDADAWHALSLRTEWPTRSVPTRESAIMLATRLMDELWDWNGWPADEAQALAWPRIGMVTRQGGAVPHGYVPDLIANATAELAEALAASDLTANQPLTDLDIRSASGVTFGGEGGRRPIPDRVIDMIPPEWGTPRSPSGQPKVVAVPMVRV